MAQRQDELGENMRLPWGLPGEPYLTFETQLTKLSKVLSILLTRALHQWWETHGSSLMTRLPHQLRPGSPPGGLSASVTRSQTHPYPDSCFRIHQSLCGLVKPPYLSGAVSSFIMYPLQGYEVYTFVHITHFTHKTSSANDICYSVSSYLIIKAGHLL